jgi:hypothetical protein
MNNRHFRYGRSTFTCLSCGRRTRDAGQGWVECCFECYELAGLDNSVNDGAAALAEVILERDRLLAKAVKQGSNEARIRNQFSYLFPSEAARRLP